MNPEQIELRASVALRAYANHTAFVQRCAQILRHAHDLGWRTTGRLHDRRAIRRAESLLGVDLRQDFAERTRLSTLIYGP